MGPLERITALSMKFSSSRILPGQSQRVRAFMVSAGMVSIPLFILPAVFRYKVANQKRYILTALPQGWNRDREYAQAVVKIAAEFPVGNQFFQITVCRCDQAHINRNGARAAEPLELLLLKSAQELRLEFERQISDFVEKQRSPVGEFQAADFLRNRSRESASFMAEEFAFEQARRNRRAVQFHERLFPARTEIVDRPGDQIFPVPVSPRIKTVTSVAATVSTCFSTRFKPTTFTDNFFKAVDGIEFLFEIAFSRVLAFQLLLGLLLFRKIANHAEHDSARRGSRRG